MKKYGKRIWLAAAAAALAVGMTPAAVEAAAAEEIRAGIIASEETGRAAELLAEWIAANPAGAEETTPAEQAETEAEAAETTAGQTETAAAEGTEMFTTWSLAMRSEATKESEKLGSVPINTAVKVFDTSAEYFEIEYEGTHGYVLGKYLTTDAAEAKAAEEESIAEAEAEKKSSSGKSSSKKSSSKKSSKKKSSKKKSSKSDSKKKNDKECLTGGLLN